MKLPRTLLVLAGLLPGVLAAQDPTPAESPPPALKTMPAHLLDRCTTENRATAIGKLGGIPESEEAVISALRFLQSTQSEDGSWTCGGRKVPTTALALLCFLGHGEKADLNRFGVTILNGLTFLIDTAVKNRGHLADDGRDNHWPYEHAIAVYALSEAYALWEVGYLEKIPNLRRAVEVGGQIIINRQHEGGGWDYAYHQDSGRGGDTSITSWHLLALKSCQLSGLEFADMRKCHKKGLDYLERMQAPSGALGYSSPNGLHFDGTTLTAAGALSVQIWEGPEDRVARKAVKFIDGTMKFDWDTPDSDLYGHFFAASAVRLHGSPEIWTKYHQMVFPEILKNQAPDGSFEVPNGGDWQKIQAVAPLFAEEDGLGRHYRTCLATLILESYYR